jgi:hypothetical protein
LGLNTEFFPYFPDYLLNYDDISVRMMEVACLVLRDMEILLFEWV